MLTVALDSWRRAGTIGAEEAVDSLGAAVLSLIDGQCADLAFETRNEVGLQECLTMAAAKTGALLGCACALGGLFAGAPDEQVRRLRAFGARSGWRFSSSTTSSGSGATRHVTGKPASSDLASRKKSLPVVAALSSGTPAGRDLAPIYASSGPLSDADIVHARELVERSGGRAWSETEADSQRAHALEHLEAAGLHPTPGRRAARPRRPGDLP